VILILNEIDSNICVKPEQKCLTIKSPNDKKSKGFKFDNILVNLPNNQLFNDNFINISEIKDSLD